MNRPQIYRAPAHGSGGGGSSFMLGGIDIGSYAINTSLMRARCAKELNGRNSIDAQKYLFTIL
jgi:hypothetical protein